MRPDSSSGLVLTPSIVMNELHNASLLVTIGTVPIVASWNGRTASAKDI